MNRLSIWLVAALAACWSVEGDAATLRAGTILRGDVVRLSDLFDGVVNDRAIGPAPDVGGRIFVEAAQLNAIARQFDLDWRSGSSGDRIVLERPGRPFPREQAMLALRAALTTAGVSGDADVDVPGYNPPMLPLDAVATPEVGQMDYDGTTGRFTALLSLTAPDMQPIHARLSGRVQEMVDVPVADRRLLPGDLVTRADVRMARLRADALRAEVARDPAQVAGMVMRRPLGPGAPFILSDLGRPYAIQKGDAVQLQLELPGLRVSAQGLAMEGGSLGEHIRVMNTNSRAVLDAEVTGTDQARLSGAPPLTQPGGSLSFRVAAR